MKRILSILLSIIILSSFSACNNNSEDNNATISPSSSTEEHNNTSPSSTPDETSSSTKEHNNTSPSSAPDETSSTTAIPSTDSPEAEDNKGISPLLYKVTDDKNNTIWLFGSIHVGKDYFYPLPDYVLDAYNNSDALAVEADMVAYEADTDAQMRDAYKLIYLDGTTIKDHLPEETYKKGVETLTEMGVYSEFLDYCIPYLWVSEIQNYLTEKAGLDYKLGIDMHLLNDAYENNKEIIEIESAEFQNNMMANFSEELQAVLLEDMLEAYDYPDLYKKDMETLLKFWELGKEKLLAKYLNAEGEYESAQEEALYKEYDEEMVVKRNLSMTNFAEDALLSGKEVFICVGAAHVVGEEGMSGQLADRGYNVEIIR